MKNFCRPALFALAFATVAGCAHSYEAAHRFDAIRVGPCDIGDTATTFHGIITGFAEGNPLMRPITRLDGVAGRWPCSARNTA